MLIKVEILFVYWCSAFIQKVYLQKNFDYKNDLDWCNTVCEGGDVKNIGCNCDKRSETFTNCTKDPYFEAMPEDYREETLHWANYYRNLLALGRDPAAINITGEGANINELEYDNGLEWTAWCNVNRCKLEHNTCSTTKRFPNHIGQNLARYRRSVEKPLSHFKNHIKYFHTEWFMEEILLKVEEKGIFEKFDMKHETGHFFQMIWAETKYIGCASAIRTTNANKYFLVCNYDQGNEVDKPVYLRGKHATKCEEGRVRSVRYSGLCAMPEQNKKKHYRKPGENEISKILAISNLSNKVNKIDILLVAMIVFYNITKNLLCIFF